mgnify:CR=1 FL=1
MSKFLNRGRFQAQGDGLEESENWAQDEPLSVEDALALLDTLQKKLKKEDAEIRQQAFEKARQFISEAGENGGISAPISKTFKVKKTKDLRVDIEVNAGIAFITIKYS